MAFRSMHGACTRPFSGSHVRPRLCSMAISAAYSTCSGVPPSASQSAAAAIAVAAPTSPWQPTSAPEMLAWVLISMPTAPAVASARWMRGRDRFQRSDNSTSTAGTMPAAPFVGAVTTRPPAAFSSFTAKAYACARATRYGGTPVSHRRQAELFGE